MSILSIYGQSYPFRKRHSSFFNNYTSIKRGWDNSSLRYFYEHCAIDALQKSARFAVPCLYLLPLFLRDKGHRNLCSARSMCLSVTSCRGNKTTLCPSLFFFLLEMDGFGLVDIPSVATVLAHVKAFRWIQVLGSFHGALAVNFWPNLNGVKKKRGV